jgi:diguanylate cyclase (GGDEF)-like protein/PAS domain S-box-containing protein
MIPLRDRDNLVIGVFSAYEDITERKGTELALRLQSRALESSLNAIVLTEATPDGEIIEYVNPAFERLLGYSPDEVIGLNIKELGWPQSLDAHDPELTVNIAQGKEVSTVLRANRKDGSKFWNQLYVAPVRDPHGRITHRVAVCHDVSELLDSQELLRQQATIDGLTRLPNRALLQITLETALRKADTSGENVAVLFLDLDHFKHINDSLGHSTGDKLLATIGARLSFCLDTVDTVARYGGDEFVLVVPDSGARDVTAIIQRVLASLSEPLFIDSHELYIAGSIGMSEFPVDGRDAETLLKKADVAMYRAKQMGRNGFQRYEADVQTNPEERLALYSRLHKAVNNDELVLQYQPQVDMATGAVIGVEALVRWRDPERGLIPPNVFIPVAEETGLIHKIGDWVLRTACLQSIAWIKSGLMPVRMSVNVSPLQLQRLNICEWVEGVLSETGLDPALLELEVTEGAIMDNPDEVTKMFDRLRTLGVHIAIDDFGTGYSSLSYLKKFKVDRIKIDRAFVRDLGTDSDDEAITRAIIGLARTMNFEVLAEGVETTAHRDFLMEYGCSMAQGYLYSRPVDADVFAAQLAAAVPSESLLTD